MEERRRRDTPVRTMIKESVEKSYGFVARLLIDSKANYQNEGRRVPVVLAVVVVAGRNRKVVHWGRQTNGGQAVSKLVSRYRLSTRSACRFIAFTRRVKEGGAVLRRCVWSHARNGKGVASL